jgi:uncharacterized protein (TIGR02231 family)
MENSISLHHFEKLKLKAMRKYFFILSVLPAFSLLAQVNSKITDVIVYQQGAKITNVANIQLQPGNNEIIIQGVSTTLDQNSIQAKVTGEAILLSAASRSRQLEDANLPRRTKNLEDSIAAIDKQLTWYRSEKSVYQGEEQVIVNNQKLGTTEQKVTVEEIVALSKFYRERLLDIRTKLFNIDNETDKLEKIKTKLSEKLNELRYSEKKTIGEIILNISSKKIMSTSVSVSYISYQAGWTPLYDIRANKADEPVSLVYKANVYQSTGLSWDKVNLTISTGNPMADNNRPTMYPWYIDFYQEQPVVVGYGTAAKSLNAYQRSMAVEDAREAESMPLEEVSAVGYGVEITNNRISSAYTIDAPQDIPSDGQVHLVAMQEYKLNSKFSYHSIPKLDAGTFLIAKVADYGNYNLLPGQANLFFEGMYIGQSYLNPQTTVDSMLLSLGRDDKIIVKRDQLKDLTARQSIGGNVKETKAFEILVRNNNTFEIDLDLMDQLPIAQNKDIEVKLEDAGNGTYDINYGSLLWKIHLKPGETKKVSFVYSVKYPKDKQLAGL